MLRDKCPCKHWPSEPSRFPCIAMAASIESTSDLPFSPSYAWHGTLQWGARQYGYSNGGSSLDVQRVRHNISMCSLPPVRFRTDRGLLRLLLKVDSVSFYFPTQFREAPTMSGKGEKVPVRWHRSTVYCALLVAATAFTCPGIFGALNGLGAGGGASPDISNAANAIVLVVLQLAVCSWEELPIVSHQNMHF